MISIFWRDFLIFGACYDSQILRWLPGIKRHTFIHSNHLYTLKISQLHLYLFFLKKNKFIVRREESRYENPKGDRTSSRGIFGYKEIHEVSMIKDKLEN
jgi:hypothetical protein